MKIVVGGQVKKNEIADKIKEIAGDEVEVEIMDDIGAANAIKRGEADYYFGACDTGGGGALGMATAILTSQKTETVSMAGKAPDEDHIEKAIKDGKVAFGFTNDHYKKAVKILMDKIMEHNN
ncbi:MAG: DUF2620 domain-containing protein [Halanaerobiales bacterium]